jgi:kumamolisin
VALAILAGLSVVATTLPGATAAAAPSAGIARLGPAPSGEPIQLVLPLKADIPGLKRIAVAVSTPGSARYGQYESVASLARRFGASTGARSRVLAYLRSHGATRVAVDGTGLFAAATMSVGLAERLFQTPLARFRTAHDIRFIAPTSSVTIPAALIGTIEGVVGLDTRPLRSTSAHADRASVGLPTAHLSAGQPSSASQRTGTAAGCPGGVGTHGFTPNQYLTAYNFAPLRGAGFSGQGERAALIEIDGFKHSDILGFARCFGLRVPTINTYGVGVSKPLAPGGEATLDTEVLDAAAPGLRSIDIYESHPLASEVLRALTAPLQVRGHKPEVISASLGLCESDELAAVGRAGINASEGAFAIAAASGVTYLAASGDNGSSTCATPDNVPLHELSVSYPASSPFVTGVGGTALTLTPANAISRELVWNDTTDLLAAGGGGQSALFKRPSYQNAVSGSQRAVPDVSMLADVAPGYAVYCTARPDCVRADHPSAWQKVGGTSAASPLLAGAMALIDQQLRLNGREDLGLVNPLLYGLGGSSVFHDVTAYGNDIGPFIPGGGRRALGCCTATPGYDDASGWGSVDVGRLSAVAVALVPKLADVRLSVPGRQRPVNKHQIIATVSCSRACLMGAYADVAIGRARAFVVDSSAFRLPSAGKRSIVLKFTRQQLDRLRSELSRHRTIVATIHGVIVDAGGVIEKRTRGVKLTIRG